MRGKKWLWIVVFLLVLLIAIISRGSGGGVGSSYKVPENEQPATGNVLPQLMEQVGICRISASRMNLTMPEVVDLQWKVFVPQETNSKINVGVLSYFWGPGELSVGAPTIDDLRAGFPTLKTKTLLCVLAYPADITNVWFVRVELELAGQTYDKMFALYDCLPEKKRQDLDLTNI